MTAHVNGVPVELHFSTLKHIDRSPAHFNAAVLGGREDTPAMMIGRAVHSLVLGGPAPVLWTGGRRYGRDWDAFRDEHSGADILNASEWERAANCAAAVLRNSDAARLLARASDHELPVRWRRGGYECAGRIDACGDGVVLDLKTCQDARVGSFCRDVRRNHYDAQLEWYAAGLAASGHSTVTEHYLIAAESVHPHVVQVYTVTADRIELARRVVQSWLERLSVCAESGVWPGYSQTILEIGADDYSDVPELEGLS